jgi:four helix bundle protein
MGTSFRELRVYQAAFALQQEIFLETRAFPAEERYSLTDQLRRASRSVGANLAEAWQKRRYPAHFLSKLTDADSELAETEHWLSTARACDYLSESQHQRLSDQSRQVGAMLGAMLAKPDAFSR